MAKQKFMLHSYIVHKVCSKLNDIAHFDWKWTEKKRAKLTHIWWLLALIKEYRPKMTGPSLMLGNRYWPNVLCSIATCIRILGNHGHDTYKTLCTKTKYEFHSMNRVLWNCTKVFVSPKMKSIINFRVSKSRPIAIQLVFSTNKNPTKCWAKYLMNFDHKQNGGPIELDEKFAVFSLTSKYQCHRNSIIFCIQFYFVRFVRIQYLWWTKQRTNIESHSHRNV